MGLVLGLDVGIASVGWCVLNHEEERIEGLGVRIFDKAENPKNGSSLAEPRRMARMARRRLRRRRKRLDNILALFERFGLISRKEWEYRNEEHAWEKDPYSLRAEALDALLSGPDLAKALFHLAKKRGFKSNRRGAREEQDEGRKKEEGELLKGVSAMQEKMKARGWRTVGEMLAKDPEFARKKRNDPASYLHTVARKDLEVEVGEVFQAQREAGSQVATEEFEMSFLAEMTWQAQPESGDRLLDKVGPCQFFPESKRAPVSCFSHEKFVLLGKLINMRWVDGRGEHSIPPERLTEILAFALRRKEVTHAQIKSILGLTDDVSFRGVKYHARKGKGSEVNPQEARRKAEGKPFFKWRFYWDLRNAILDKLDEQLWNQLAADSSRLDAVGYVLTVYKTDSEVRQQLLDKSVDTRIVDVLVEAALAPDKFGSLSLKAIALLLPEMENGKRYDEACAAIPEIQHHSVKQKNAVGNRLPPINYDDIRNPVVMRALSQSRKVVNAIIARYGKPGQIHVEMSRDLKRSFDERREIKNENDDRNAEYERERERFVQENGHPPRKDEFLKWRLYRAQNGRCAYTDDPLEVNRLFEVGYCEVDHILPWSRSFDDSFMNKVLISSRANREKLNLTPYEYLGGDSETAEWNEFRIRVQNSHFPKPKKDRLLRIHLDAKATKDFRDRNLNDTRYIARYFSEFVKQNLGVRVVQPTGRLTAYLRKRWGLVKSREESHLHHAQDAAVIAATSQGMIQRAARYSEWRELGRPDTGFVVDVNTGEIVGDHFPRPWENFTQEVKARLQIDPERFNGDVASLGYEESFKETLKPVFPSFAPRRKVTGESHPATIVSKRSLHEEFSIKKVPLEELKLNDDGGLDLFDKEHNQALHDALVARMNAYDGNAKKAFKEQFHKPTNNGNLGPLVRGVKVVSKRELSLQEVRGGMSGKGGMVRSDVFSKDGKFWLVPVYVSDTVKKKLPNLAIIAHKPESEWKAMDDGSKFLFSLYPNDLVEMVDRAGNRFFGYYVKCHRGTAGITLRNPVDSTDKDIGSKTVQIFRKFVVDPLGDVWPISAESRQPIKVRQKPRPKSREAMVS